MTYVKLKPNGTGMLPGNFVDLFDNLLEETLGGTTRTSILKPLTDIIEREKSYEIQLTLPGFTKENISVTEDEHKLTIKGERKKQELNEGEKFHLLESRYGKFERTFNLPDNVNKDNIRAEFKEGILYITIEKSEPQNSRVISIE